MRKLTNCEKFHNLASQITFNGNVDLLYQELNNAIWKSFQRINIRAIEGLCAAYIERLMPGIEGRNLLGVYRGFTQYLVDNASEFGTYRVAGIMDESVYFFEAQKQSSFVFSN